MSYSWNHNICSLFRLAAESYVFKVLPCLLMIDRSFLFSSEVYLPIHQDTEGCIGCFQVLAIMNKTFINIYVGFYLDISFQLLWMNIKEHEDWIIW